MPYPAQLKAKAGILRDQFARIGKIEEAPVEEMVASPNPWNYRNHVQFHLTREGLLGFVRAEGKADKNSAVFPISECHLPEPAIDSFWPHLEFEPGQDLQRVSVRLGADEELMLVLESGSPDLPELEVAADISAVHLYEGHAAVMAGADHLRMRLLGRELRLSAGSFFQVNSAVAEKMVGHVLGLLPDRAGTILDVYCGAGLFSAFLAPRCSRLIGIESSPSACEDFAVNLDEFDHVELYEGSAEEILPGLVGRVANRSDFVLDPPRAGLERRALDAIVALGPESIVYVSCDPSTLARDAARLIAGGYRLRQVTPFDLFPQTFHIESISLFTE
jgi:23S rRNA (uracil1939-C5)-methyltransferase